MKFTEKGISDGWENTVEASNEFMKDEILWEIRNGEYSDVSEIIEEFADYIEEFSADEISFIENAIDERLEELEEQRERQAEEEERLSKEWEEELAYMNREYFRSIWVA